MCQSIRKLILKGNLIAYFPYYQKNPLSNIDLKLNTEIERIADKIVDTFSNYFPISGKDPKGICAGAIYIATRLKNLDFTQKEISEKVGITEITLRSRYKEIKTKLNILLQEDMPVL